ncbi:hypothetical protein OK074_3368 [Actinobacteria bacterium OK074]|nr:hypothetical protein OK074_3368 [Actinobacteria bacterium OK074]
MSHLTDDRPRIRFLGALPPGPGEEHRRADRPRPEPEYGGGTERTSHAVIRFGVALGERQGRST